MTKDELFLAYTENFRSRKFIAGLLIAIIDLIVDLDISGSAVTSYNQLIQQFPKQEITASGRRANTLILKTGPDETISLRPFYNSAERLFRSQHKRFDYPSCAPHATQAWPDYVAWIDALCMMSRVELDELRQSVVGHVLKTLPSHEYDPSTKRIKPPIFRMLLEEFEFKAPAGEKSGAAFQGAVFGFMRADNPHLQVEIDNVRTGSKRLQRVGDIDAWEGERLAISAEVKNLEIQSGHATDLAGFANEVRRRGAIGLVVGQSLAPSMRDTFSELGISALDVEDLVRIVELWDPAKQEIAVESMRYYASHVEKDAILIDRLRDFVGKVRGADGGK